MEPNQSINQFHLLNRTRIERLSKLVTIHQQDFFKLLPFLFHINVPELPGFVDNKCPVGITDYQPDDKTIRLAQKLNSKYKHKRQSIRNYGFSALYLVNPYGLLSLPKKVAFEIVLVHRPLSEQEVQAAKQKQMLLIAWAEELDITLSFTFLDEAELATNPLSYTQLSELYLNGLSIAGAIPLWWAVPYKEPYASYTGKSQPITTETLIDFGPLPQADPHTRAQQLEKQLSQAIEQGIKHCLPLISAYLTLKDETSNTLSSTLKLAIEQGERDPINIDIKALQIEQVQQSDLPEDIKKLAQQSLYLYSQEALSKHVSQPKHPWRRKFIQQYQQDWFWASHDALTLDRREPMQYSQSIEEHQSTFPFFSEILQSLKHFIKKHQLTDIDTQNIENKLLLLGEAKPHIIHQLPKGLIPKAAEEKIHLYRFKANSDWRLSLLPLESEQQSALYQTDTLLGLIAWAISNGLLNNATRILVADKTEQVNIQTAVAIAQALLRTTVAATNEPDSTDLTKPAYIKQLHLFANLEPNGPKIQQETQLTSLHSDPFNYAKRGGSLLHQIDVLILSSWGEWHTLELKGRLAPLTLLQHLLPWWQKAQDAHPIHCWCLSEAHGPLISRRLESLCQDVKKIFGENKKANYLLQVADQFHRLTWQDEGIDIINLKSADLSHCLQQLNTEFIPTYIDNRNDPKHRYNTILSQQKINTLTLVIEQQSKGLSIHIVDNLANVHTQQNVKLNPETALRHFQHFLSIIQKHQPDLTLQINRLNLNPEGNWQLSKISPPKSSQSKEYLPVVINLESSKTNSDCTIVCGPKTFKGKANDPALLSELSSFLINLRNSKVAYPLYINEINFAKPEQMTTADYFIQKQWFEKQLNHD